jgi:hypothetical protein
MKFAVFAPASCDRLLSRSRRRRDGMAAFPRPTSSLRSAGAGLPEEFPGSNPGEAISTR